MPCKSYGHLPPVVYGRDCGSMVLLDCWEKELDDAGMSSTVDFVIYHGAASTQNYNMVKQIGEIN